MSPDIQLPSSCSRSDQHRELPNLMQFQPTLCQSLLRELPALDGSPRSSLGFTGFGNLLDHLSLALRHWLPVSAAGLIADWWLLMVAPHLNLLWLPLITPTLCQPLSWVLLALGGSLCSSSGFPGFGNLLVHLNIVLSHKLTVVAAGLTVEWLLLMVRLRFNLPWLPLVMLKLLQHLPWELLALGRTLCSSLGSQALGTSLSTSI